MLSTGGGGGGGGGQNELFNESYSIHIAGVKILKASNDERMLLLKLFLKEGVEVKLSIDF